MTVKVLQLNWNRYFDLLPTRGGIENRVEFDILDAIKNGQSFKLFTLGKLATIAWGADLYVEVADVDTDDLNAAYRLTNNIECAWTENEEVTQKVAGNFRSTSVGDIFILNNTEAFVVGNIGFIDTDFPKV